MATYEDDESTFVEINLLRPDLNAERNFPGNFICTARYTSLNSFPLSLLNQFRRISNLYFLIVAIFSLIPGVSPINPYSNLLPLFIVLGVGIAKDLWEDYRCRKADSIANSIPVNVLRGNTFTTIKSRDVVPGDVMLFSFGEEVRADCVILNTSLPDGLMYIETSNLDGETNAKTRRAHIQTVELFNTVEDIIELAASHERQISDEEVGSNAGDDQPFPVFLRPTNEPIYMGHGLSESTNGLPGGLQGRADEGFFSNSRCSPRSNAGSPARSVGRAGEQAWETRSPTSCKGAFHHAAEDTDKCSKPHGCGTGSFRGADDHAHNNPLAPETRLEIAFNSSDAKEKKDFSYAVVHSRRVHSALAHTYGCSLNRSEPAGHGGSGCSHLSYHSHDAPCACAAMTPRFYHRHGTSASGKSMFLEETLPVPGPILELSRRYEHVHHRHAAGALHVPLSRHPSMHKSAPRGPPSVNFGGGVVSGAEAEAEVGVRPSPGTAQERDAGGAAQGLPDGGVTIVSAPPCADLSSWFGSIRLPNGALISLSINQFLPRGCTVRNTKWVLAAVVFTGENTKMLLNARPKRYKTTAMMRRLNQLNLFLFIITQVLIFTLSGFAIYFKRRLLHVTHGVMSTHAAWYVQWYLEQYSDLGYFWRRYLTFFVLLSYLIPISLYVTLEFNQALQMMMISSDKRMAVFDEFAGRIKTAKPKTSELNSQLGLVEYIFTDKTGTLTENMMTYVGGTAACLRHDERSTPGGLGLLLLEKAASHEPVPPSDFSSALHPCPWPPQERLTLHGLKGCTEEHLETDEVYLYLRALALCHSVVCFDVTENDKRKSFPASPLSQKRRGSGEASPKAPRGAGSEAAKEVHAPHSCPAGHDVGKPHGGGGDSGAPRLTALPHHEHDDLETARPGPKRSSLIFVPNDVPDGYSNKRFTQSFSRRHTGLDSPSRQSLECEPALYHTRAHTSTHAHHSLYPSRLLGAGVEESEDCHHSQACSRGELLRGLTSSTSWYYNRYNTNATLRQRITTPCSIDQWVDYSKIYEGQSLDEIALVNAARENGFCLYGRTAKQMFIKVMGRMMCYNIIAELEFSAQRKLMSILLQRCPEGDSQEGAEGAAPARSERHYHRVRDAGNTRSGAGERTLVETNDPGSSTGSSLGGGAASEEGGDLLEMRSTTQRFHILNALSRSSHPDDIASSRTAATCPKLLALPLTTPTALVGDPSEGTTGGCPYFLLVKGADTSMLEILNYTNPKNVALAKACAAQLEEMANQGLRTLVFGQRYLTAEQVQEWLPTFHEAQCATTKRSERLHEAYALLEKDLDFIGTSAVEDKLQDGVPETLRFFSDASIVVWMLTGDKRETAVTIAFTSGLIKQQHEDHVCHLNITHMLMEENPTCAENVQRNSSMDVAAKDATHTASNTFSPSLSSGSAATTVALVVPSSSNTTSQKQEAARVVDMQLTMAERKCAASEAQCGSTKTVVLVVDGKTLDFILDDPQYAPRFFALGKRCFSAVCCRMTPLQKSKIVRLFQKQTNAVALAIGDGSNDVSMIQESRIGVSIMGLEGSQAELASDYAIPKFRFLKRLLMVHGRFSLYRHAHCILFSLYKSFGLLGGLFAYSFYSACSGQSFVDSWLLAIFNIILLALQPLILGVFDKDVEDELAESLPQLYPPLAREYMYFSWAYITKWLMDGIIGGLAFFFFLLYTAAIRDDLYLYKSSSIVDYGAVFLTMLVLVADLRAFTTVAYHNIFNVGILLLELIALPCSQFVYSYILNIAGSNEFVYVAPELYGTGKFYIFLFFAVGVLLFTMASNLHIQIFAPWQNAAPATFAARASPHRAYHRQAKMALKEEYLQQACNEEDTG